MSDPETSVYRLDGLVAVVTGAAQGLGLGIARRLGQLGARVVMADLQVEKVQRAAKELSDHGVQVLSARHLDITDSSQVATFFQDVVDQHGRLDALVNNAGLGQDVAAVVDLSDEQWDRVIRVTLTGTFYCCRTAGGIMERQE